MNTSLGISNQTCLSFWCSVGPLYQQQCIVTSYVHQKNLSVGNSLAIKYKHRTRRGCRRRFGSLFLSFPDKAAAKPRGTRRPTRRSLLELRPPSFIISLSSVLVANGPEFPLALHILALSETLLVGKCFYKMLLVTRRLRLLLKCKM